MLSIYGIILCELVLGVALMIVLFAPNAPANGSTDPSSKSTSELQSEWSGAPTSGLPQTELSLDVTDMVDAQPETIRSSESRRAEMHERTRDDGGPMGEIQASGSSASDPNARPQGDTSNTV